MEPRFIQIHTLTSFPGTLLNRDDAGFAKRLPFGGASRIRISSQCLKRHWRTFTGEGALSTIEGVNGSVRSRLTFERRIVEPLIADGLAESAVREVAKSLMTQVLGQSAKAKKAAKDEPEPGLETGQITVLGEPEVEWLKSLVREACQAGDSDPKKSVKALEDRLKGDGRKNAAALGKAAAGLDAAMFGRMVTSDLLARGDAAVHVAHAFTVHAEEAETDYFSAVDDLLGTRADDETLGAGHIGTNELTSGLFYGYVVIDVPLLVSNIEGCEAKDWKTADRSIAAQVAERMVQLIATVSPGAKLGSTAPHAYAQLVLGEIGKAQPRTLANAFLRPTSPRPDLLANAYGDLARHVRDLDSMYGASTERAVAGMGPLEAVEAAAGIQQRSSLSQVASWIGERVRTAS